MVVLWTLQVGDQFMVEVSTGSHYLLRAIDGFNFRNQLFLIFSSDFNVQRIDFNMRAEAFGSGLVVGAVLLDRVEVIG